MWSCDTRQSTFLDIRRFMQIRNVDEQRQLLKKLISNIVVFYMGFLTENRMPQHSHNQYTWNNTHLRSGQGYLSVMDAVFISYRITVYVSQKENSWWRNVVLNAVSVDSGKFWLWINPACTWALYNSILTDSVGMSKV